MTSREYMRERRARLLAAGLCIDCGKSPKLPTIQRCDPCNVRQLSRVRVYSKTPRVRGAHLTEIAAELGVSRDVVRAELASAIRKVKAACKQHGLSVDDFITMPRSMMARLEDWAP